MPARAVPSLVWYETVTAWLVTATARNASAIVTNCCVSAPWVAESMKARRICGLARSNAMAASNSTPSASARRACGRRYVISTVQAVGGVPEPTSSIVG